MYRLENESKFFEIEFEYLETAAWRGPALSAEAAQEYLLSFLKNKKARNVTIINVKEVPTFLPEEEQGVEVTLPKRVVN